MTGYANTPTVVAVLVPMRGGLLMIHRALPGEGEGQLALPGGYQVLGQTCRRPGRPRCGRRKALLTKGKDRRGRRRGTPADDLRHRAQVEDAALPHGAPRREAEGEQLR